jgi:hypothetical protein
MHRPPACLSMAAALLQNDPRVSESLSSDLGQDLMYTAKCLLWDQSGVSSVLETSLKWIFDQMFQPATARYLGINRKFFSLNLIVLFRVHQYVFLPSYVEYTLKLRKRCAANLYSCLSQLYQAVRRPPAGSFYMIYSSSTTPNDARDLARHQPYRLNLHGTTRYLKLWQ